MRPATPKPKRHFSVHQFQRYCRRFSLCGLVVTGIMLAGHWASGAATTLAWDADTTTTGIQDGSGNWDSTTANWWNGAGDVTWMDSTTLAPVFAQFGGGSSALGAVPTITVNSPAGGFNVAGLIFASETGAPLGYVLGSTTTSSAINIANGGTITVGDNTSTSGAFITINSALSGNNITIQRTGTANTEQFIQLSGSNTWNGTLTLNGGTSTSGLFVRATTPAALNTLNAVVVPATVTLDLQGDGATYTPNFQVAGGGDGASPSSQRGAIRFDNSMTLSGGITLTGNAVLNFQSSTPTASNVTFTGGITESGGSFSFTKTGLGTLTLQAASSYSGSTIIAPAGTGAEPGALLLDFANASPAVTTPMLYNGVTTPGALILTGNAARDVSASTATFSMLGAMFVDNTQSFSGLTVAGPTAITLTSGLAGSVDLSLGGITRTAVGSMLAITSPSSGNITTTTNPGTLLGTWATYTDPNGFTTWAGTDSGGNIGAFTGDLTYATGTNISGLTGYSTASNLRITNTSSGAVAQAAGATTLNTITMSTTNADRVVTVGAGNTLDLGAVGGIQLLSGSRSLTVGAIGNAGTLTAGTAANAELFLSNFDSLNLLTVNSVIANNAGGAINVELNGIGTVILTGANTYTGTTIVNSGILEIASATALGASATAAENTLVGTGATLALSGGITIAEPLSLSGFGASNLGALHNLGGNNTSNGLITLNGGASIIADAGTSLTLFRTSAATTVINGTNNVTFGGSGNIFVNSVIATQTGTLTKTDSGTLFLNAANTYTGSTTISSGVVQISNATSLGTVAGGTTVTSGAALQLTGGITVGAELLFLNGTGINNGGALRNISGNNVLGGTITLQSATRINSDANTLTLSGTSLTATTGSSFPVTFGGAGNITVNSIITTGISTLTKDGSGVLTLSGANTYTGLTTISGGTLALGANDVFANTAPVTIDGGTFSIGTFSDTLAAVILRNGAITGSTEVLTSTATYNVQNGTVSAILAGSTTSIGLTKSTTNTVTLSGANTYAGTTTIQDGRLVLDYSGSATVLPVGDAISLAGGTLEVKGAAAGITLGPISTAGNSGLDSIVVDANTPLTATSYNRGSGSALFIDLSAAGSSLKFTTAPLTASDGEILGTGGSNAAVVMKDSNGRYDFAALGTGNSVVRLNATTALPTSGGSTATPYLLTANNSPFSLSASETISTLRIDTTAAGGTLDVNGKTLTLSLFGILNDGSNDFTITNSGTTGGLTGTSAVFLYQYGTGKLTLNATINNTQTFLMGNGLIDWTAASGNNTSTYILGATVRLSGTGLTLNNSVTTGNGIGVLNIGNGGILELNSGDFTRGTGSGTNLINFLAGDAGFSAFGADRVVNLGGTSAPITWGATTGTFLASGAKLILGSPYANATVDFQNPLNLNAGYQTVEVQSPNATGVGGKISGNITGTGGGLTKAGQGILNLAGANTYTGFTAVSAGTLLLTGSIIGSSAVNVGSGAELKLSGTGTVSAGTLSLADTSKLSLEVGTLSSAPISLSGNASLTGNVTLALTLTSDLANGTTFTLIDGNSPLAGYNTGARFVANGMTLAEGSIFNVTTGNLSESFQISYAGGSDGNDVTILVVPEPSVLATLLPAFGLIIGTTRLLRRGRLLSKRRP